MSKYKLYTAELVGVKYDGNKKYEMVIITKWKDRTDKSSAEGHKVYYFNPDFDLLAKQIKDENWCKEIYENHSEYTRFKIKSEVKCYAENINENAD